MNKVNDLKNQKVKAEFLKANSISITQEQYTNISMSFRNMHNRVLKRSNYSTITICDEWYTFSNYLKWFCENMVEGWDLDKDLKGRMRVLSC